MNARDLAWRPIVPAVNAVQRVLIRHHSLYRFLLVDALEPLQWGISRHRAAHVARRAQQHVPAYRDYYPQNGGPDIRASAWDRVPVTDKESFVKRYRIEDRWAAVRRDDERASSGPDAWYADAWSGSQANPDGESTSGGTYGAGRGYGGRPAPDRDAEWSGRALPTADSDTSWRRGNYEDDDRGGDDRWR